jgi:hypothetical protein
MLDDISEDDNESPGRERRALTDELKRHTWRRQMLSHYSSDQSHPSWAVGRSYQATGGRTSNALRLS